MKTFVIFLLTAILGVAEPALSACQIASSSLSASPNLISYWRYEDNANDTMGLNNGTDVNMTYDTGQFGRAGVFNGASATVSNGTSSIPMGASVRTVSMWVRLEATAGEQMVVDYGSRTGNGNAWLFYGSNGAGKLYFNAGGVAGDQTGATTLSTVTWYNLIQTFDGTTSTLYLDGVQEDKDTLALTTSPIEIMYRGSEDGASAWFNGRQDDFAIFDRVLTSGEITEINGSCVTSTPPVASATTTQNLFDYFWNNYYEVLWKLGGIALLFALILGIVKVIKDWDKWFKNNLY